MELNFIKANRCPICGCNIVIQESVEKEFDSTKIREHVNGGRWEHRKFACGCEICYCPNFRKEEIKKECSFDPKKLERDRKRMEARDVLYSEIRKLDVDEEYKAKLKDAVYWAY